MFNLNLYNICELYGFADHNFGDIGLKYDQLIFVAIAMWLYLLISTLLDITTKNFVKLCFNSREYEREIIPSIIMKIAVTPRTFWKGVRDPQESQKTIEWYCQGEGVVFVF